MKSRVVTATELPAKPHNTSEAAVRTSTQLKVLMPPMRSEM